MLMFMSGVGLICTDALTSVPFDVVLTQRINCGSDQNSNRNRLWTMDQIWKPQQAQNTDDYPRNQPLLTIVC